MGKKRCILDVLRPKHNLFLKSKKAQVTIFIILGIVLLLAVVLVFVLRSEITTITQDTIPTNKGKVENFITACMKNIGDDSLQKIGLQAGYVQIPQQIVQDANSHLRTSPITQIPYWAQGTQTFIPTLEDIKRRIDLNMEQNLRKCVIESGAFKESYNMIEHSDITSDVQIIDSKVRFLVHWEIDLQSKAGESIADLSEHIYESDVKLKRVYELAKRIVEDEMKSLKIEDITQDLIALEHKDLPVSGFELSCDDKKWGVEKAKNTLKDLLRINLKQLKIKETDYVEFPEELPYYNSHYIWNIGEQLPPSVSSTIRFENNFPFTFQVTPSDGRTLRSSAFAGNDILRAICLQSWKFTYDVSYPVIITARDLTTNYNFNIAMTIHLVKNQPNRKDTIVARLSQHLRFSQNDEYCANKRVPMTVTTSILVDNDDDVYYTEPLEDADISFTCIKNRCEYGQTELNFEQSGFQSGLTDNFPYCVGAIVRATKDGHLEDWKRVVTRNAQMVELNLVPTKNIEESKIKIIEHILDDDNKIISQKELSQDQMALITIKFDKNDSKKLLNQIFHESKLAIVPSSQDDIKGSNNLTFLAKADFTYDIEINIIEDEKIIGGYKTNWTADWASLENANQITFNTVVRENPSDDEMFDLIVNLDDLSKIVTEPQIE
jgi:hypothetical protein